MVLPYINMHQPQVYMCSPSWTPLPPLPIPSLWVIPVHQPQASCILHRTWTGNSFLIWYYTCNSDDFIHVILNINAVHVCSTGAASVNIKKNYLVYLAVLGLGCSKRNLCFVMHDLSFRWADSLVEAGGLSCSLACGILILWQGIGPTSPALQGEFLTTGSPEKSSTSILLIFLVFGCCFGFVLILIV